MKHFQPTVKTWKSPVSIALLYLSLFSVSIASYAQEKEQFTIKNKTFAYEITKETTAADLAAIEKEINAEKVASLRFSDVKRNAQNEIVGITTQFNDERGSSQKKSEYNSQGIRPFAVKIHENAKGDKHLEITNDGQPFGGNTTNTSSFISELFSNESTDTLDFGQNDIMNMMRSMQESMRKQQELMQKIMEESGR